MKEKKLLDGRIHEKERLFHSQMRALDDLKTSSSNKKKIEEFVRDKQLVGIKNSSVTPYLSAVIRLLNHVDKDLEKISAIDLKKYFFKMQNSNSARGEKFSAITLNNNFRNIKFFYRWMNNGTFPECVSWIKENGVRKTKLPADMLTEEDIEAMIRGTDNTRDQAIISVLYDSAARVGEFCNVRIRDIQFDKLGALMRVDGKTGIRNIRLIESVPYLQAWLQVHPFREDREQFVWFNVKAQKWAEVNRQGLSRILNRAKNRAKIKKRVHPHIFRHSRLTALAPKVTEQVLKNFAGWSPDSRMAAVYIHMSGKNIDAALAKAHGIEIEETKQESRLAPITCPRCKTKNPSVAKYCSTCSMVLSQEEALLLEIEKKGIESVNVVALKDKEKLVAEAVEIVLKKMQKR